MSHHLVRDINLAHRAILSLSAKVEEMIDNAASALKDRRADLAEQVAKDDQFVDQQEVAIEDQCLKMLALHHPVAVDLRRIATMVKVNNDLERMADLAVSIANRSVGVSAFPDFKIPGNLDQMVEKTTWMVRNALDAFVNLHTETARTVIQNDELVDELNVELIQEIQQIMQANSDDVVQALHCFSAIRHLERIADLATNIAEDVIYLVEGEIVRHSRQNFAET